MSSISPVSVSFQSTLPARGATNVKADVERDEEISIHAPREGSDAIKKRAQLAAMNFNPRSPRGERPVGAHRSKSRLTISIHAPREGSDFVVVPRCPGYF